MLSDLELAAIWYAVGDDAYGKMIKLLILTGCRREEIAGMAWSEFSEDGSTWTLPATRSKNGMAHTLPITDLMREVIESVPHIDGPRSSLR